MPTSIQLLPKVSAFSSRRSSSLATWTFVAACVQQAQSLLRHPIVHSLTALSYQPTHCSRTSCGESQQTRLFLAEKRGPADSDDFITRIFGRFLPTPEDVGLKRYDSVSRPENYPCVKNEWAELLPEDTARGADPDIALVRQVLAKTNMEFRPLRLAFSAQRDGWNAEKFHAKLDKQGPAVVLARTTCGKGVIGGYNPTGWVNYGEYRGSIAAFLFTFPNGDIKSRPVKLAKISGAGLAQIDDGTGPKFGMEGLTIPLGRGRSGSNTAVRSKLGLYYERMPDGSNSLLPGAVVEDSLKEVKVFAGVYEKGERIPYSDALPYQLN